MESNREDGSYESHKVAEPLLRRTGWFRTALFLGASLVLFAAANAFWQYLHNGQWVNLSTEALRRDLVTPFGEIFVHPLSILIHPWMIVVISLLLAALIFVPIIVAVLYRLLYAGLFVLVLALVGQSLILALALATGCVLSARTRLRSEMPFLAVLLGMLPAGAYLYLFGFAAIESAAMLPLQRWVLTVPFLLAVVASMLASAVVLGLARLTRFRPGVIWPVLLVLAAASASAFYVKIGPGELDYALIANRLAPGDAVFDPIALDVWRRQNAAEGLTLRMLQRKLEDGLDGRRRQLVKRCEQFLAKWPASVRGPTVMWILAQSQSLQLDLPALEAGLVKYSASYVPAASRAAWERLSREYPGTGHATIAQWRLGCLTLRELANRDLTAKEAGELLRDAEQHLHAAAEGLEEMLPAYADRRMVGSGERVFWGGPAMPGRRYCAEALFAVQRLIWLIDGNDVRKDIKSARALAEYLDVNPHEGNYCERLEALLDDPKKQYEGTKMGDNLILAVAKTVPDPFERVNMLISLAEDQQRDAAIEANYELGRLVRHDPFLRLRPDIKHWKLYFERVFNAPPNPWRRLAAEQLSWPVKGD